MAGAGAMISGSFGLAGRYAQALYTLAEDEGQLDPTIEGVSALGRLIDESADFRRMLTSPVIDVKEALAAVRAVLEGAGFSPLIIRFAGVVATNRRLRDLRAILSTFGALAAERRGVVTAHVATAHPLSSVQREQLRARLIEAGYGQVNIEEAVDPALLGGLVLRIGAKLYDSSLKSRLQRLQYAMRSARAA